MDRVMKLIIFIIIAAMNIAAQIQNNVTVTKKFLVNTVEIVTLNFRPINHYKVNNHDVYYSVCRFIGDSISADTLGFLFINAKNILIRGISFSRNGHIYCSADSFPARDSLKWKTASGSSSLVFADSLLYFSTKNGGRCFWILGQKYTFYKGDTFKILLEEPPELNTPIVPQLRSLEKQSNSPHSDKFMPMGNKYIFLSSQNPINPRIFDLNGKKHSIFSGGTALYIFPPMKEKK